MKVDLGPDKWTGRMISVESTMFGHGSRCKICQAVRRAVLEQDADLASIRYVLGSDDTNPPVPSTGFEILEEPDESSGRAEGEAPEGVGTDLPA